MKQCSWAPVTALCLFLSTTAATVADTASIQKQIEAFLVAAYPADQAGAAVIVTRDGEVLFRGAYGMADLELGLPLEPDMVFRLGSITKQFTGAAIALLEQQGKLSVEDPITKYLPDYPTHGHTITVAHLLAHTSGIRSYTGIPGWMATKIKRDMTVDELIGGFKNEPMDFAPGERWLYDNSGYVLLGAIIEKASEESYEDFVHKYIFTALGMESSYYGDHGRIIPRRTPGYDGGPGEYQNAQYLSMTQPYAAGSLLSTVDDLATWDRSLYSDDLLSDEARVKLFTPFLLNDGSSTDYVGANPLYWTDPTGLVRECIFTPSSDSPFKYSPSGKLRPIDRRWDKTFRGPVSGLSAPLPPEKRRRQSKYRLVDVFADLLDAVWKCQTTHYWADTMRSSTKQRHGESCAARGPVILKGNDFSWRSSPRFFVV